MHVCMLLFSDQPQNVRSNTTATSVVISWQQPTSSLLPDSYSITLTYTNNTGTRKETISRVVQVPGNATEVEYDQLASEQDYDYCVSAVYGPLTPTFCFSFQTALSHFTTCLYIVFCKQLSVSERLWLDACVLSYLILSLSRCFSSNYRVQWLVTTCIQRPPLFRDHLHFKLY